MTSTARHWRCDSELGMVLRDKDVGMFVVSGGGVDGDIDIVFIIGLIVVD